MSVAIFAIAIGLPGQTVGFSPFSEPLLTVTGLSRTNLSIAYFVGTLMSGLLMPQAGRYVDAFGARRLMCFAAVGLGVSMIGMSLLPQLVKMTLATVMPLGLAYMIGLSTGIFCLRFFGQGLLPVVANTLIGRWFEKNRGHAGAILSVSSGLMLSATPYVLHKIVATLTWQGTWMALGVLACTVSVAIAWIFCRDSPEECGLSVDGGAGDPVPVDQITGCTVEQAGRTWEFWTAALITCGFGMLITGVTFHIVAIGAEAGLDADQALVLFVPAAFFSIPASFTISWISDRIGVVRILQFMGAMEIVAFIGLTQLHHNVGYALAVVGIGTAGGCFGPILAIVLPTLFGRRHIGSILGKFQGFIVINSAIGPLYFAVFQSVFGQLRYGSAAGLLLPIAGLLMTLRMNGNRVEADPV